MMSRIEQLCFFDKEVKKHYRRRYKRYRKPPELLPFSVRLTGLSGAVRVEAYLKQQQTKENKAKDGKGKELEQGEVSELKVNEADQLIIDGQVGAEQNQAVLNNLYKVGSDLKQETEDVTNDKKTFNLPNLNLRHFTSTAIKSFEQLEGDDEEEDTQRFLFEENKFAAPNLLAQLGKLIDFLHGKQVEEFDDILSINSELDLPQSVVNNDRETEILRGGGIIVRLPEELTQKLSYNFEGLSANAVYVKREWQTASYREQAILHKRLGTTFGDFQVLDKTKVDQKPNQNMPNEKNACRVFIADTKEANKKTPKDEDTNEISTPTILAHRKDSRVSNVSPTKFKPKTRLEKFKFYADKEKEKDPSPSGSQTYISALAKARPGSHVQVQGGRGHAGHSNFRGSIGGHDQVHFDDHVFYEDEVNRDTSEAQSTSLPLPGSTPSMINFSLLSRYCVDKGWVVPQSGADDLERQTMIEWARARLLQVIKERDEAAAIAKELKEDGPVLQKWYGDAQLEAAMKYKKGVSWAKRWKKMTENDKKSKFLIAVPDGTTFCYYQSGRMALCAVKPGSGLPGKYTFAYGDSDEQPFLATFTPSGTGCCYNSNGGIRFVSSPKFGALFEEDGTLEKKWRWPLGKLQTPVVIQLNKQTVFRCTSQSGSMLYFNCQNETAKFPVGIVPGVKSVKIEELGFLQTDNKFTSQAALQSIKVKPKKKEKRRKTLKPPKTEVITEEVMEERQKELEEKFPERKEIEMDAPWQLELLKLQRKVKNLVCDWMDFYRISVGIVAPKRVHIRRSKSHSAKSLPGSMPSSMDQSQATSLRSPSAPPIPRGKTLSTVHGAQRLQSSLRSHSSAGERTPGGVEGASKGVTLDVPKDGTHSVSYLKASSIASGSRCHSSAPSRLPFRCGIVQQPRSSPPRKGCCVALRTEMLGDVDPQCRCDRRRIPLITDLEYDIFLKEHVPRTQMIVISVTSSLYPDANPCDGMLDQLFYEKNRDRSIPCVQARNDPFRLLRYDIAVAAVNTDHQQSLLLTRHNAVPGMFLMYIGGKLLFADHIFNGYGNAKKDFLKQIMKTRKDSLVGKALPYDFRLTPTRGRSGPRAAWGGEIGGPKISSSRLNVSIEDASRITSASTDNSKSTLLIDNRAGAQSAASFIKVGLSINSPFPRTENPDNKLKELPKLNTVA